MWSATLLLGLAPIHRVLNEGVRGPIYSAAEVGSSGSCKGTQPLSWLKLHVKGQLEGLQSAPLEHRLRMDAPDALWRSVQKAVCQTDFSWAGRPGSGGISALRCTNTLLNGLRSLLDG